MSIEYFDREFLEYTLKEIRSHKGTPYQMANEPLVEEMFSYIKKEFPMAIMVKQEIDQYIVVSKRAKTALVKLLKAIRAEHEKVILEVERSLDELDKTEGRKGSA